MAYLDIASWQDDHVVSWLRGLHHSLKDNSLDLVTGKKINGKSLMLLTAQELVELVPGMKVEALHSVLGGIELLRYISHDSNTETLQSLTLSLACQARYLYNLLIQAEHSPKLLPVSTSEATPMTGTGKNKFDFAKVDSNMQINQSTKQRVSLETLDTVSIIVDQILYVVDWLNSTGLTTSEPKFNKDFKSIVLRVAVELTSTAQRDQFVEQPNDVIKKTAKFLADYCEWVVMAINDPDFIQPCWLDVVSIKKKPDEEDFGIVIQPTASALLTIEDVPFTSAAHRSGRIAVGDELIQVDYQTVLGWPGEMVQDLIKKYTSEVILTIKKRHSQSFFNPSINVIKPRAIPLKRDRSIGNETKSSGPSKTSDNIDEAGDSTYPGTENENTDCAEETLLEPPKEPKGPVYELRASKRRRELKRRVSISGSISDALVDLSLADALPIPSVERPDPGPSQSQSKTNRVIKESLTKSVSHDTAKLYLHTLSIDKKHLWLPQNSRDGG